MGYYFGRDLEQALHVPIGLINANIGGTTGERWLSKEAIEAVPEAGPPDQTSIGRRCAAGNRRPMECHARPADEVSDSRGHLVSGGRECQSGLAVPHAAADADPLLARGLAPGGLSVSDRPARRRSRRSRRNRAKANGPNCATPNYLSAGAFPKSAWR